MSDTKKQMNSKDRSKQDEKRGNGTHNRDRREKDKKYEKYSGNSPEWYKITQQLADDVFNIPFNVFPGTREKIVDINVPEQERTMNDLSGESTPGVMVLNYALSCGNSNTPNSAVNIAARSLYSWVRHKNSGHTNYESVDLMLYVLAMEEAFSALIEAKRIYRTAMTYSMMNKNIPDLLLAAMGVNGSSIRQNLAQFRAGINLRIAKATSMAVPKVFTSFLRHAYLASNVFTDSTAKTSQFYVFKRSIYRVFDPTHTGGGALIPVQISNGRNYNDILDEIDAILDPILSDEDMNIMSGDILKAFDVNDLYFLTQQDEYETVQPIFDEAYLNAIHNSTCYRVSEEVDYLNKLGIYQENGVIKAGVTVSLTDTVNQQKYCEEVKFLNNSYFNSHKDDPTVDDVIESSRLITGFSELSYAAGTSGTVVTTELIHGTELLTSYEVWFLDYNQDASASITHTTFYTVAAEDTESILQFATRYPKVSKFDWAPMIYLYIVAEGVQIFCGVIADLKRYTLIAPNTVARMHDAAIMAEYGALLLEQNYQVK